MSAYFYITFRSVTYAQRAEGLVRRAGIGCVIQRAPRAMETRGCGYCLRLAKKDVWTVTQLLRENEIPYRKVYYQGENGALEEAAL